MNRRKLAKMLGLAGFSLALPAIAMKDDEVIKKVIAKFHKPIYRYRPLECGGKGGYRFEGLIDIDGNTKFWAFASAEGYMPDMITDMMRFLRMQTGIKDLIVGFVGLEGKPAEEALVKCFKKIIKEEMKNDK